jgi:hypothetical protein
MAGTIHGQFIFIYSIKTITYKIMPLHQRAPG